MRNYYMDSLRPDCFQYRRQGEGCCRSLEYFAGLELRRRKTECQRGLATKKSGWNSATPRLLPDNYLSHWEANNDFRQAISIPVESMARKPAARAAFEDYSQEVNSFAKDYFASAAAWDRLKRRRPFQAQDQSMSMTTELVYCCVLG